MDIDKKVRRLRWLVILGGFLWFFGTNISISANEVDDENMANKLNDLNLFVGTDQGYELDNQATRNQSAVMLVRYLGVEEASIEAYESGDLVHPFLDVPSWAAPHVAYLYQAGLTKGISDNKYGGKLVVTGNQYATMLLRMLGYDDLENEFYWTNALEFYSEEYNVSNLSLSDLRTSSNIGMTRGQMVRLSYLSLYFDYKDKEHTVIDSLYYNEVITGEEYSKYGSQNINAQTKDEVKAIWISYLDLKTIILDTSAYGFRKEIQEMLDNVKVIGMNTVFVQVRPFSDALYESNVYDWSFIMTGTDGGSLGFDPFNIIVEEAKLRELRIDAWINPYRIRHDVVKDPLNPNGMVAQMMADNPNITIQTGNRLMFNPAFDEIQELIIEGVEEIVNNYDIDGVHFDDYFYPSDDLSLDIIQYEEYLRGGGNLSHDDYRRHRIDILIRNVYTSIKTIDESVIFGVSPQGSTVNNYEHTFIDVQKWIDTSGYIDYICPQIYYGFDNETLDFNKVIDEWSDMVEGSDVDLYVGLAAYKIGQFDTWAGTGGAEWQTKNRRLKFMIEVSRNASNYKGLALFRYDSLFNPLTSVKDKVLEEIEALTIMFKE